MIAPNLLTDPILAEHARRVDAMMDDMGLDALIVYGLNRGQNDNVEYLTGICRTNGVLFYPRSGAGRLFVLPKALVPFISRVCRFDVRAGGDDYAAELIAAIRDAGCELGAIGLVEIDSLRTRGIPHLLYEALRDAFPRARFPTVTERYERTRSVLLDEERAALGLAATDLDRAIDVLVDAVRPGVSAAQIIGAVNEHCRSSGITLTALSARSAAMDGSTLVTDPDSDTRALRAGDYFFFESNTRVGPFTAYRGFPIALGEPAGDTKLLFDTALEVAKSVAAALRPGATCDDVVPAGDVAIERGLWSHGPLANGLAMGGWQMISLRGFDGYRAPTRVPFEVGMAFQAFPHLMLRDNSKITIIGSTVVIEADGPRVLGSQGLRAVVK